MKNLQARLKYHKETGIGLETILNMVENPQALIECICPECGEDFEEGAKVEEDLEEYIDWLEKQITQ